ncbi:MAG: hypothetical protein KKG50_03865 [Candidatus Omnitrophica bacterium]|nr:hypothetical protein [Candidatus Omnitrophota bacterium]
MRPKQIISINQTTSPSTLPKFLEKYFWDVDFEKIDPEVYSQDILARLLEYGDEKAINWMKENFSRHQIADVLSHYRLVSPKSANFWAIIFNIDKRKVLCLQKHYLEIRKQHWPY